MRRRRLPLDTRPKWDDPGLGITKDVKECCFWLYLVYDQLPRSIRDVIKEKDFILLNKGSYFVAVIDGKHYRINIHV